MRQPAKWDTVFLTMAHVIATKSKDPSTQVGAILVDRHRVILADGFNGPPPGLVDEDVPWEKRPDKYGFVIHAEENALLTALDGYGKSRLHGATLYTTHAICGACYLRSVRAEIKRIVWPSSAPDYPMSRFDCVSVDAIRECECYPKIELDRVDFTNPLLPVDPPPTKFVDVDFGTLGS